MADFPIPSPDQSTFEEIPERLDEQHIFTKQTLGFLIHPSISLTSSNLCIADIGTGTGIFLLDLAQTLPPTSCLRGFDITASGFPSPQSHPSNISFQIHDIQTPFPASEIGVYDIVTVRFISSATTRADWARTITNLTTLLKPSGWLQWIESCNFALYNSVPGTSRAACREVYDALEPFRAKDDLVIGMMMREVGNMQREDVFRQCGLVEVHEDVFSTDRLQDPGLRLRERGTRNAIECFLGSLTSLVEVEGSGWSRERIEGLRREAMREIDEGVYHTLDQVCIIGRKA